jgi:ParB-like chromosome segregation protein Spo0J
MSKGNSLNIVWTTQVKKIKDLKPHSKNPRKLSKYDADHLQKSLEKFGLVDKPIVSRDGIIIGGHQRIAILKKMGEKEVECFVPDRDLDAKDMDELNIRLNRNLGEWDFDILANEWNTEDLIQWGFTTSEFAMTNEDEVELDESIVEDLDLLVKFKIEVPEEDSHSFEIQLQEFLKKFPRAKMEKKI